jgi:hypothetical protein
MKRNRVFLKAAVKAAGLLVVLLALGLVLIGCDTDSGDENTGTFRIRVTGIPSNVMAAGQNGQILIGIGPANATNDVSDALAGRDTSVSSSTDRYGNDWYEFSLYNLNNYQEYIGSPGNYDIGFMFNSSVKVARNRKLAVNTVNEIPYSAFQ